MKARFSYLPAIASIALVGCSGGDDSPSSTTDTGVAVADTGMGMADTPAGDAPSCAAYCDAISTTCFGVTNKQYAFVTLQPKAICNLMCNDMTAGSASDTSGDTVGCRLYHANLAKDDAKTHCPHAGATGGGACGASRCDVFCKLAVAHCGSKAPFASEADCKTQCTAMTFDPAAVGGEIDQVKGTLNCVQYHLQASYDSAAAKDLHCPHLTTTKAGTPCTP